MNEKRMKLSMREKICYGMGDGGANIFVSMISIYLTAYYTDTMGVAAAAIGTMMLIARLFDGVTDLIMGAIVDKTRSKYGKARPWIMWTAPLMTIGLIVLFNMPQDLSQSGKIVYAYVTYICANCIIYTANNLPYNALLSRMTLDVKDRGSASAIRLIITQFITMVVSSVTAIFVESIGFAKLSIVYGIIMFVLLIICFFGTKEHIDGDEPQKEIKTESVPIGVALKALVKNKYFFIQTLMFIILYIGSVSYTMMAFFYCRVVLNAVQIMAIISIANTLPNIIMNFFTGSLYGKYGKRKMMLFASALYAFGSLLVVIGNTSAPIVIAGVCIRGFGMGSLMSGVFAGISDVVDYGEWKTGIRSEGLVNSGTSFGMKVGIGLGSAIGSWLLALGHYNGAAMEQADSAINAIRFGFGHFSVITGIVLFVLILFNNIDKLLPEIQKSLEEKHTQV